MAVLSAMCTALISAHITLTHAADAWQPRRPIEIVVPSAPGGGLDLVARTLQSVIQQENLSTQAGDREEPSGRRRDRQHRVYQLARRRWPLRLRAGACR